MNRAFLDYQLDDFSGWLKDRVVNGDRWEKVSECVQRSGEYGVAMDRYVHDLHNGFLVPESTDMFY
jgi:hypothetical protein